MKKICLLLGLFAAGAPPSLHGFTLSVSSGRTRESASSSFACFLIRSGSTSSTSSNSGRNEIIPFFATRETSSPTVMRTENNAQDDLLVDSKKKPRTTKSVYEKTPQSHHIKLTDYLRNPRSLQMRTMATTTATTTSTAATSTTSISSTEPKQQQQQQGNLTSSSSSIALLSTSSAALLEEAISTFDNAAAKRILAKLNEMRRASSATTDTEIANFLNGFLEQQQSGGGLPRWTRFRFLSRFSKRARLASLRRTLDLVTPPTMSASESSNQKDDNDDDIESKKRRRRRAFVSLLNTLAKPLDDNDPNDDGKKQQKRSRSRRGLPAIAVLEKKARREQQRQKGSLFQDDDDLTLRRPQNLETPKYTIVAAKNRNFEIRCYEPYSLCSVNMAKARPPDSYKTDAVISEPKLKGASSFGALAGYLFGKNQQATAMKMTTPVFTTLSSSSNDNNDNNDSNDTNATRRRDDEKMSFVLPSEFWKDVESLSMAPQPLEGSGVTLERINGGHRAVVMFGGYATKENVAQQKQELLQNLDKDPEWRVAAAAAVSNMSDHGFALAQYNDPFTPPWKRLNEVSIAVERR